MTIQKGSLFLLKVGDGQGSENFSTVGGMRTTRLQLNNQVLENTNLDSGAWRSLQGGVGISSVSIAGSGLFTDAASEETVRSYAFSKALKNYELHFGNGDVISGTFQISSYERAGDTEDEEGFSLSLESSGEITYTAA